MDTTHFNWLNRDEKAAVRICISDKLSPLLPHSHNEAELMFFYNAKNCHYMCNGREILFSSGDMLTINPGDIHSCDNWGDDCIVACIVIDLDMLALPFGKHVTYASKISDLNTKKYFDDLMAILSSNTFTPYEKECKIYSIIYEIFAILSKYSEKKQATHAERI